MVDQDVYDDLAALATRHERSVAAELRVAIRDHLARAKAQLEDAA